MAVYKITGIIVRRAGITPISGTDMVAVVDNSADEVFVANSKGVLQARFNTSWFSLTSQGIAFDSTDNVFAMVDSGDDEVSLLRLPSLLQPSNSCKCDVNDDGDVDGDDLFLFSKEFGRNDCP